MGATRIVHEQREARSFDVICFGAVSWKLVPSGDSGAAGRARGAPGIRLRSGGGAGDVAVALAKEGLRVGLAAELGDDAFGRVTRQQIAAHRVDTSAVAYAKPRLGLVLTDASGGATLPAYAEREHLLEVPEAWSSRLLLLSGLSPVVSHAAALCKAARTARRQGTLVVLDFNASLHQWAGHDPRTIRMVLREVDVARCSVADRAVLGMAREAVQEALRPGAVLIAEEDAERTIATGPFGEVAVRGEPSRPRLRGTGDVFVAALCAELLRRGDPGESPNARWHRTLQRAHAAVRSAGARAAAP